MAETRKNPTTEVKETKRGRKKTQTEEVLAQYDGMTAEQRDAMERGPVESERNVAGGWNTDGISSDDNYSIIKENLYIEIELLTDSLGMMPPTKKLLEDYIASKAPDAKSKEEEIAIYGEAETADKQTTIWPVARFKYDKETDRMVDVYMDRKAQPNPDELIELPFLYNYQFRGLMKDACGLLSRAKNNESADMKAYKKVIDGNIFVFPRHIAFTVPDQFIDDVGYEQTSRTPDGRLNINQRQLRISGPTGERTAISSSEFIPAGSKCKLRIGLTSKMWIPAVKEWLNYGQVRGIGQWRNSGSGLFRWRELGRDWLPLCPAEGETGSVTGK